MEKLKYCPNCEKTQNINVVKVMDLLDKPRKKFAIKCKKCGYHIKYTHNFLDDTKQEMNQLHKILNIN